MSWGYVAVGAATVISGAMSADASKQAAKKQARQAKSAAQREAEAAAAAQERLDPFQKIGLEALQEQRALSGLGTPEEQAAAFAAFTESPGQQFLREQQERALLRSASAIGGLGGGNIRTALQEQAFQRAQTDYGQQFNRLAALSGSGQVAATQQGAIGVRGAGAVSAQEAAAAEARASGILGQQQAQAQTTESLIGLASQSGVLS